MFQSINSREKSINKWINLNPSEIKKSAIVSNTLNNMMKVNTNISISYIGNFPIKSMQNNEECPTKLNNTPSNLNNISNKKYRVSSNRTNNNNNNSALNIESKNKHNAEPDIKNAKSATSKQEKKDKHFNNPNLILNNISQNLSISGNLIYI